MAHEPADDQVVVGVVTGAFGLNGDVKVELHTSSSDRFSQGSKLFLDGRLVTVQTVRAQKKQLVVKLDAINNRDMAESVGGHFLTIPEEQLQVLPEDQTIADSNQYNQAFEMKAYQSPLPKDRNLFQAL